MNNSGDNNYLRSEDVGAAVESEAPTFNPIRWSASTTIETPHSPAWNLGLLLITLSVSGIAVALSIFNILTWFNGISIIILVVLAAVAILVVAKKPAHEAQYMLDESGITIDGQLHPFSEYRAFGVRQEGALWQLVLIPIKRLAGSQAIFIDTNVGEEIVDILGARFPMEDIPTHPIDKLTHLLKL